MKSIHSLIVNKIKVTWGKFANNEIKINCSFGIYKAISDNGNCLHFFRKRQW